MQIPGVLYFPRRIVKDLEEIRAYNEYTYGQLVADAISNLRRQRARLCDQDRAQLAGRLSNDR